MAEDGGIGLRITQEWDENVEFYTEECKERVRRVFQTASQMIEMQMLLDKIKKDSILLKEILLTEKEQNEIKEAAGLFDSRMQMMVHYTFENLEKYQLIGWREFFDDGDSENERNAPSFEED